MLVCEGGSLVDVDTGKKLMTIKSAGCPSNKQAGRVIVSYKGRIRVFDIKTKELIVSFTRGGGVIEYNLRISGDGNEVLDVTDMKYTKIRIGERKK